MQFVYLLFKHALRNLRDYEANNIWLTRLAGWSCKTRLAKTNKGPWQAGNGRKIKQTNWLWTRYKSLQINIGWHYGDKIILTDSSIYQVEIAQFQDLNL